MLALRNDRKAPHTPKRVQGRNPTPSSRVGAEVQRSGPSPPRGRWSKVRLSPSRQPGASFEVQYWDDKRRVKARLVLRRFEVCCILVAGLALIVSLFGDRLPLGNLRLVGTLLQFLTTGGW